MAIRIQLPEDIEQELRRETPDLNETAREEFLISQYKKGKLSTADIAETLGFATRFEAQQWLAQRNVPINYSLGDLEQD